MSNSASTSKQDIYAQSMQDIIYQNCQDLYEQDTLKYHKYMACATVADKLNWDFLGTPPDKLALHYPEVPYLNQDAIIKDIQQHSTLPIATPITLTQNDWLAFLSLNHTQEWKHYRTKVMMRIGAELAAKRLQQGDIDNTQIQAAKFLEDWEQQNAKKNQQRFIVQTNFALLSFANPVPFELNNLDSSDSSNSSNSNLSEELDFSTPKAR